MERGALHLSQEENIYYPLTDTILLMSQYETKLGLSCK